MPLYDYRCEQCFRVVHDVLGPYAGPPMMCANPDVHAEPVAMVRLPSSPSFHVKGFSSQNGYSGGQEYEVKVPSNPDMRVVVKS